MSWRHPFLAAVFKILFRYNRIYIIDLYYVIFKQLKKKKPFK